MNLEETRIELRKLIIEVNASNSSQYYERFGAVVRAYRDAGGSLILLQNLINELDEEFGDIDQWKEEHIIEISNRISGYASPNDRIEFEC